MSFSAAILTGGSSTRMGTDKAFVEIEHRPMVQWVRDALEGAGAAEIYTVGGDVGRLDALGFDARSDTHPGEGPLCGLVDALTYATTDRVVVMACDQPGTTTELVRALLDGLVDGRDAVVPVVDGIAQPLAAVYAARAVDALRAAVARGERSPSRALDRLRWHALDTVESSWIADVDDPDDLARYAASRRRPTTDTR
jgi:molybdopterin-guanine dinucleotide biosynthesis protein A